MNFTRDNAARVILTTRFIARVSSKVSSGIKHVAIVGSSAEHANLFISQSV
jgi:hypothetical protein